MNVKHRGIFLNAGENCPVKIKRSKRVFLFEAHD